MSEWKEYKLGEIATFSYGRLPNKSLLGNGPYTTYSGYKYQELYPEYNCNEGDVILVARGVGGTGDVKLTTQKCYLTNLSIKIDLDNDIVLNKFFYYIYQIENLRYLDSGSAQSQITIQDLSNVSIEVPSIFQQKEILSILSSLDDKIDLLNRENATLEAMAETLFRQWFIKEAKEDWEEVALGDVVKTTSGGTPSRKYPDYYNNGTIYWVKSKELQGSFIFSTEEMITEDAMNNSSAKLLPEKSVLIAMYGATVGEYGILSKPMTCNQAVCALIPNNNYPYTYLYLWTAFMKQEFINLATGAAQQNISQDLIKQQMVSGDIERIKKYHEHVCAYFDKMECNQNQIKILSKQRDILLPKLMSNEITIQWGEGQFYYI